jgi:hypothetical protein
MIAPGRFIGAERVIVSYSPCQSWQSCPSHVLDGVYLFIFES